MPVILALRRLRQGDCKFEAILGYIAKLLYSEKKREKENSHMTLAKCLS
jgi:hypothetical protein